MSSRKLPISGYEEAVIARIERLLTEMGWTALDIAKAIYQDCGYASPKAIQHIFDRVGKKGRHIPTPVAIVLAAHLEIDPAYVLLLHDDLVQAAGPRSRFRMARDLHRMRSKQT